MVPASRTSELLRQLCRGCTFCIPSLLCENDDRCSLAHATQAVKTEAAYPTVEWMRGAAGMCGPKADAFIGAGSDDARAIEAARRQHESQDA